MPEAEYHQPVKAPQTRGGRGESAVYIEAAENWGAGAGKVYVKRQHDYYCRPAWRLFRKTPTLRRELRGLRACSRLGVDVPAIIGYSEHHGHAALVLAEVAGALPLDGALAATGADRPAIVSNVATAIGRLHRGGWCHGALYPEHVLVGPAPTHAVTLIDLEKARHSRLRRRSDLNRFWRHNVRHLTKGEIQRFHRDYQTALGD